MQPVLAVPGVMVGGSQVPNLLQPDVAATLVVSQDVDLVVPVGAHEQVLEALTHVAGYRPSSAEPSVWLPDDPARLEINFIGRDPNLRETSESYVLEHATLPLLVFGLLSFLREGRVIDAAGTRVPLPRPAGLLLEKLLTERSGLKGDRDLLVALGLLIQCSRLDLDELVGLYRQLPAEAGSMVLGNLAVLSLMQPLPGMPDPIQGRSEVERLVAELKEALS